MVLSGGIDERIRGVTLAGSFLSFGTSKLDVFKNTSKKAIYYDTIKVIHQDSLRGQKVQGGHGLLKPELLLRGQVEDPV